MPDCKLALIGAGNMAEAIVRGVLGAGLLPAGAIVASDPVDARRDLFRSLDIDVRNDNRWAAAGAEVLLLAIKPQHMRDVVAELADVVGEHQRVVSIMAGITTASLEAMFPKINARVVRVMPNLPMAVKAGIAAVAAGRFATGQDVEHTCGLFRSAGDAVVLEERHMDAVTAMSGSGPAYFYYFVEAMIEAGVTLGLKHDEAAALAKNTALGAARMMLETDAPPAELRRRVTSPGGTTLAAITSMNAGRVKEEIVQAVQAAARRSAELSK